MTTDVQFMPSAARGSRVPGFGRADFATRAPLFNADDLLGGVKFAMVRLFELLTEWQARERQRRQLRELDDRLLRDIGISRVDAGREARKPFWQV